ncbi:MAG: hypothetical protein DLM65_14210 [Candidatus Aeolococcus gillhamiae]|uniref:DUF3368 domain-containing protein n=1 Tax=Candidatus Aeolococcus gillhamiae TaxID=3127015 RepID=A0A2W5Z1P1_9BACT|nr:MAG: hypothetical protein DLM65_14210 [Candidatus Dormibacter sp. RRmetagenome_bin12]
MVDSSTWISLARAGLLDILRTVSVDPVLVDVVHAEIVDEGRRGGYPDATALSAAVASIPQTPTSGSAPVDARILDAAQSIGMLIANDLALGRRARSLGIAWIRTADLVILAVKNRSMSAREGIEGLSALEASGRITQELADAYREQLQ